VASAVVWHEDAVWIEGKHYLGKKEEVLDAKVYFILM
jgi:hypothetical protein